MTVQEIITDAHIELSVIATGSAPTTEESEYAKRRLIEWLDQESMAGLMQSMRERSTHTFAEAKLAYLMSATAGDVDIAFDLPAELDEVSYRQQTDTDFYPLRRITVAGMERYADSDDIYPSQYLIEQGIPARIQFDALPVVGDEVKFIGPTWLTADLDNVELADEIEMPRGYGRALKLGLAIELAPSLGVQLDATTRRNFYDAMRKIRARNVDPARVVFDRGLVRNFARGLSTRRRRRWR